MRDNKSSSFNTLIDSNGSKLTKKSRYDSANTNNTNRNLSSNTKYSKTSRTDESQQQKTCGNISKQSRADLQKPLASEYDVFTTGSPNSSKVVFAPIKVGNKIIHTSLESLGCQSM